MFFFICSYKFSAQRMNKRKALSGDSDTRPKKITGEYLRSLANATRIRQLTELLLNKCVEAARDGQTTCRVYRDNVDDLGELMFLNWTSIKKTIEDEHQIEVEWSSSGGFTTCGGAHCSDCRHCYFNFEWADVSFKSTSKPPDVAEEQPKKKKQTATYVSEDDDDDC